MVCIYIYIYAHQESPLYLCGHACSIFLPFLIRDLRKIKREGGKKNINISIIAVLLESRDWHVSQDARDFELFAFLVKGGRSCLLVWDPLISTMAH